MEASKKTKKNIIPRFEMRLYICTGILVFSLIGMTIYCISRIASVEKRITEMLYILAAENREHLSAMKKEINDQIIHSETILHDTIVTTTEETIAGISGTRRQITQLDNVYSDILEAQEKKSLEALYSEDAMTEKIEEAEKAFSEEKYLSANRLYTELSEFYSDNNDMRFYRYYSLFLSNKADRNNYRQIKEAFQLLERNGYTRNEIGEVFEYIENEIVEN
jgi:hypothetical protein